MEHDIAAENDPAVFAARVRVAVLDEACILIGGLAGRMEAGSGASFRPGGAEARRAGLVDGARAAWAEVAVRRDIARRVLREMTTDSPPPTPIEDAAVESGRANGLAAMTRKGGGVL